MKRDIITSAIGILVLTLFCGILYPLVITGISQVAFPGNANGQQVHVDGKLVGSQEIGQNFGSWSVQERQARDAEWRTRSPTPTRGTSRRGRRRPCRPNNAAATTFSNLGPNSVATEQEISSNIQAYISLNGPYYPGELTAAKVPVDAANTSASGIDPDISVRNADIQAHRVAAVRHLPLAAVMNLVSKYTGGRGLGFSGEPGVNVLELNLALDRMTGVHA